MLSGLSGRMDFDNFQAPNLKGLTIYNADVEDIDFRSFSVRTLKCLNISYNRISTLDMSEMEQLSYLDISHQLSKNCY